MIDGVRVTDPGPQESAEFLASGRYWPPLHFVEQNFCPNEKRFLKCRVIGNNKDMSERASPRAVGIRS